ncbi:MAG: oligosaccharide flippase family protein [Candidatus Omnitrophica bacterium]|nr:oligosaccharide flippase family protein [Candidatus Omnitrophota bacterium]
MKLLKNISQSPLFEKVVLASSDQALLSGLGFLISIILIKTVSKTEYGYYSITMPILLFFVSIQNAIVNTPLTVLLSEKKDDERKTYLASLCYGQFMIILPAVFVGLLFALLLTCFGFDSIKTSLIAVLSFSAIGILYREFLRSCFYAEGTPLKVLKLDICYIVLMLVFIAFQYFVLIINVNWIYINMCVSGLLISLFFYRNRGWNVEKKSIKESYQENWKLGKWALFGVFVTHIQNYCYIYLLGALLNTVAVADVSAARLLVMPLVMLRIGWSKIAIPHGSKLRELGQIKNFTENNFI